MTDRKTFIPLENNPAVLNSMAHKLGLSSDVQFHDLFSLTDPDILATIPRPALALLFIYPATPAAEKFYEEQYAQEPDFDKAGDDPVLFYRQVIIHACGLIGLLHCVTNGARSHIRADSELDTLIKQVTPLKPEARAQFLHDSEVLDAAHDAAAHKGDTEAPPRGDCPPQAFIAFVKGSDGHLYELEGRRKGPIDRGLLPSDADVLSEEALKAGPLPFVEREMVGDGNVMFSCTVLA